MVTVYIQALRGFIVGMFMKKCTFPLYVGKGVRFKRISTVSCGRSVTIRDGAMIGRDVELGAHVKIGAGSYIDNQVTIGKKSSVSRHSSLLTGTHDYNGTDRRAGPTRLVKPLVVGCGAWIGTHVVILPQVGSIGSYAVVGAGSVVTKPVEENALVAGNPARMLRYLPKLPENGAVAQPGGVGG
jgi:acetyltransferase-like isoleucine patch superfamily enzyme